MKKRSLIRSLTAVLMTVFMMLVFTACGLNEDDITGVWKLTLKGGEGVESQEASGNYEFYRFDPDGTFTIEYLIAGETLKRTGTWIIDGSDLIINVPGGEGMILDGIKYSENEIVDAVVDVTTCESSSEEGFLGSTMVDNGNTYSLISEEKYQELLDSSKKFAKKEMEIGKRIEMKNAVIKPLTFGFMDEIRPENGTGQYKYYTKQDGKTYIVLRVEFKNGSKKIINPCQSTSAQLRLDDRYFGTIIERDMEKGFYPAYGLEPGETGTFIIFGQVDSELRNSENVSVTWSVPKKTDDLASQYSESADQSRYIISLK